MNLNLSSKVRSKLHDKHRVSEEEIIQCFCSREKGYLLDEREGHKTTPPTRWFIAETDYGRLLKVACVFEETQNENGERNIQIHIKSAYEPNDIEISIYNRKA